LTIFAVLWLGHGRVRIPHMKPDQRINEICLQIQSEMDADRLLQLIDLLDAVLDVKERFMANMAEQRKPFAEMSIASA